REEILERREVDCDARSQETVLAKFGLNDGDIAVRVHEPQHASEQGREAIWQPVDGSEVQDPEPAVVQQPEIARMRVSVQQSCPSRAGKEKSDKQQTGPVPLLLRSVGNDFR